MSRTMTAGPALALAVLVSVTSTSYAGGHERIVQHRRPAAAVLIDSGKTLAVANRKSGSLCLIDLANESVREQSIGQQLSDFMALPNSPYLLATDFAGGTLIVLQRDEGHLRIQDRADVANWPESVCASPFGNRVCVASLWSRRLTFLEPKDAEQTKHERDPRSLQQTGTLDLPFAPGDAEFVDDQHLVATDAFGGRLALVNARTPQLVRIEELPVHNIRQARFDGGRLYLTAQQLNSRGRTEPEHVHWGVLLENLLLSLDVAALIDGQPMPDLPLSRTSLGGPGNGAGDPEAIAFTEDRLLVTLAGTDELGLIDRVGVRELRVSTDRRPVDVVVSPDGHRAFVVNQLADSVTVMDLKEAQAVSRISLGPAPEDTAIERGERAFFDATLSYEGWFSCHSCHTDGHTNNRLADTLGDSDYGSPKRVPSLLGVWSTGPWAWNGSQPVLQQQISKSLETTLLSGSVSDELVSDLSAYLTSLRRPPSLAAAREEPQSGHRAGSIASYQNGFESAGCADCHNAFTSYTSAETYDVGLSDSASRSEFNPPSLIGVSQRDRLLHDGRARSIDEVLGRFQHPSGTNLSDDDRRRLVKYLRSL